MPHTPQLMPARRVESLRRQQIALDLRAQRKTYREIGEYLGVGEARGHQIVAEAIATITDELKETAADVLMQEVAALDVLARRAWQQMGEKGIDADAFKVIQWTMERRAKYLGLDAPIDMRVGLFNAPRGVPTSSEIDLNSMSVTDLEELERIEIARSRLLLTARKVAPLDPSLEVTPPVQP